MINDYFIIDFESNQTIVYANIARVEKDEMKVYVTSETQAWVLEFEKNEDARLFYNNLHNKIPMRH